MSDTIPGRRRRLLILTICCASVIVVVMDISIVNVALPEIRHDLRASVSGLQWTVDAYTLVLAASMASAGRQTGTALGVALAGTIVGPAIGGPSFTVAARGVWWLVLGLGAGILVVGRLSTGRRAAGQLAGS